MTSQTRKEAVSMVRNVLEDPARGDRFLRRNTDGRYFTTIDKTFLSHGGERYVPRYVRIPEDSSAYKGFSNYGEIMDEWSEHLLTILDEILSIK